MKEGQAKTARCPHCGKEVAVTCVSVINCDENPALRQDALSGRLFEQLCPYCRGVFRLEYPLFYLDRKFQMFIRLSPEDSRDSITLKVPSTADLSGCRLRLVSSLNELTEKINLFANGFDDKVVEYCKAAVLPGVRRSFPDQDIDGLYFLGKKGEAELNIQVISGDKVLSTVSIERDAYENAFVLLSPHFDEELSDGTFLRIGSGWIHSEEGKKVRKAI